MKAERRSYLEQMQVNVRQPLHRDTVQAVEFEVTKRTKGFSGPVPVVAGKAGAGKTSLLKHIESHQRSIGRLVGFGEVRNGLEAALIAAVRQVITQLSSTSLKDTLSAALSTFLRASAATELTADQRMRANDALMSVIADVSAQTPAGILLLLDDIDGDDAHQALALTDGVHALSDTGSPLLLVCSSSSDKRNSRWPRSQMPYRINPTVTDIVELAASLGLDVSRDEMIIVAEQCNGNLYDATNRLQAVAHHRNPGSRPAPSEVVEPVRQLVSQLEDKDRQDQQRPSPLTNEETTTPVVSTASPAPTAQDVPTAPTAPTAPPAKPLPVRRKNPTPVPATTSAQTAPGTEAAEIAPLDTVIETAPPAAPPSKAPSELATRLPSPTRPGALSVASKFSEVASTSTRLPADTGGPDPFRSLRKSERRQSLQQRNKEEVRADWTQVQSASAPPTRQRAASAKTEDTSAAAPASPSSPFGDDDDIAALQAALAGFSEADASVSLRDQSFKRL